MYLCTSPSSPSVKAALDTQTLGLMCQPGSNRPRPEWIWAADNGCFAAKWDKGRWLRWLDSRLPRGGCLFGTVPDLFGDHERTLERWEQYAPTVKALGYPLAFVAQDGASEGSVPWQELDVLFIGGTTRWKLGPEVKELIVAAHVRGKLVHVGRVNSQGRFLAFAALGCDTADGTYLAFGPEKNLPNLLAWVRHHRTQMSFADLKARAEEAKP